MAADRRLASASTCRFLSLAALCKHQRLTRHALADLGGVHMTQIQRFEKGDTQPTVDVIRRRALALTVSSDALIFDPNERGLDDELKLQFEAVRQLPPEDRQVIKLDYGGVIVKHRTKQLVARRANTAVKEEAPHLTGFLPLLEAA